MITVKVVYPNGGTKQYNKVTRMEWDLKNQHWILHTIDDKAITLRKGAEIIKEAEKEHLVK